MGLVEVTLLMEDKCIVLVDEYLHLCRKDGHGKEYLFAWEQLNKAMPKAC